MVIKKNIKKGIDTGIGKGKDAVKQQINSASMAVLEKVMKEIMEQYNVQLTPDAIKETGIKIVGEQIKKHGSLKQEVLFQLMVKELGLS